MFGSCSCVVSSSDISRTGSGPAVLSGWRVTWELFGNWLVSRIRRPFATTHE